MASLLRKPGLVILGLLASSVFLRTTATARADDFEKCLIKASLKSSLVEPGSHPFHLKLEARETRHNDPQYKAEIEVWWAGPDKWRREVHSAAFSQTAVENGGHYYESNSSDYLPWWLDELIRESVDPIPVSELTTEDVDFRGRGCAKWQSQYSKEGEKIEVSHSACFNPDGTAKNLFTSSLSVQFDDYQPFSGKQIARSLTVWPGGPADVKGVVTQLEKLKSSDSLFTVPTDTGRNSRMQFLTVPENVLEPDTGNRSPFEWPVIHNFPATGAMTINLKLDRNGNVREVGSIVSRNFVLTDAAREQVRNLKFKPYLRSGYPVQVNTNITLRFEAKVVLLGANGNSNVVEPFLKRIAKEQELSNFRREGSKPFHLHASLEQPENTAGSYEETWLSPTKWRREARLSNVTVLETRSGDQLYRKVTGAQFSPKMIDSLLDGIDGLFPGKEYAVHEADWGQSAVQLDGVDVVRVARGKVDEKNQPITGSAYWFDSAGLLRAAYVQPRMVTYSDFTAWSSKEIPRRIEVAEPGTRPLVASFDPIESPGVIADTFFTLEGVRPENLGAAGESGDSKPVPSQPIFSMQPVNPGSEHGTVLVYVELDTHGHVRTATVRQSAGQALDDASVRAAMQWEFAPRLVKGKRVSGVATLRFDF